MCHNVINLSPIAWIEVTYGHMCCYEDAISQYLQYFSKFNMYVIHPDKLLKGNFRRSR